MTAEEYLKQYSAIAAETEQREKVIERMEKELFSGPDTIIKHKQYYWTAENYEAYTAELKRQKKAVSNMRRFMVTVLKQIDGIENSMYRSILLGRYINGDTWEDIAREMPYSTSYVKATIKDAALNIFSEQYKQDFTQINTNNTALT